MLHLYNILFHITLKFLKIFAQFNPKIKLFLDERKQNQFPKLDDRPVILIHSASLGEYEQGYPLIEELEKNGQYQIIISFFSPSGYIHIEKKKIHKTVYFPLDVKEEVLKFLNYFQPKAVFFIKYEFWPNMLRNLFDRKIPTYSVSSIFRPYHFKGLFYPKILKNTLKSFTHLYVQDRASKQLLLKHGIKKVTIIGDTRFDKVIKNFEQKRLIPAFEAMRNQKQIIIFGSTWSKDEELIEHYISQPENRKNILFVIAPHHVDDENINKLKSLFGSKAICYSEIKETVPEEYTAVIIDTIGLLKSIYYYADIAYIGGGFQKTGIHNLLEAAVYGKPIIIGPRFSKYNEAIELHAQNGLITIFNQKSFNEALNLVLSDKTKREMLSSVARNYICRKSGATKRLVEHLSQKSTL